MRSEIIERLLQYLRQTEMRQGAEQRVDYGFPNPKFTQGATALPDIITVFACLKPVSQCHHVTQLGRVTEAMLSMTGRVTMRALRAGRPRWQYRTVQRFSRRPELGKLQWLLIRHHLLEPDDVILMGGDEVVVTKSGKMTYA